MPVKFAILKPVEYDNKLVLSDLRNNLFYIPENNTDGKIIIETAFRHNRNVSIKYSTKHSNWIIRKTNPDIELTEILNFPELIPVLYPNAEIPSANENNIALETDEIKIIPPVDAEKFHPQLSHPDLIKKIHTSYSLKPEKLFISEAKWKYLIRSVLIGKNILITGHSGCGKSITIMQIAKVFNDRPFFMIPLGSTQDPRATLIGNTHFNKIDGTFFDKSYFVKAIQTPNAIIMLDELSRAHPEAGNILMPVLDYNMRFLRLDEAYNSPTISVADGVTFMSTANIGMEYTATRKLDRALIDRFTIIEMDILNQQQEFELLSLSYPNLGQKILQNIAEIAHITREEVKKPDSKINTILSTRSTLEIAGLIYDGFSLAEAAEVQIYPIYSDMGGDESERTFIKQLVQKYLIDNTSTNLFTTDF